MQGSCMHVTLIYEKFFYTHITKLHSYVARYVANNSQFKYNHLKVETQKDHSLGW